MSDDYDSPWKEVLERFFPQFMAFFFPDAHREIDWQKGWQSCDKELQQIVRDAELGKRLADKVMKVSRAPSPETKERDAEELYVYAHLEVQGQRDARFPQRMFTYNYRLYDRYGKPVVSLAILGDESRSWRPDAFGYELWGCEMKLRFPVVKLRDYEARWGELEASTNPFAIVVMAHLKTQATHRGQETRLQWKLRLYRRLHEAGYGRKDAMALLRFIDWILELSPDLDARFRHEAGQIDAEKKMQYVTTWERHGMKIGMEKGMEKGIKKGKKEGLQEGLRKGLLQGEVAVLRRLLARRFGPLPEWVEERLEGADREELERWAERVLEAEALEEVFA